MRLSRLVLLVVAIVLLVYAAVVVPLPSFFLETPGDVLGLAERVTVSAPVAEPLDGDFLLTTVYLRQSTAASVVGAWFDADTRVIGADELIPPGVDPETYFARQQDVFNESAQQAAAVALRAAGFDVGPEDLSGEGAMVVETIRGSAAEGVLLPGDVITAANGRVIEIADDLREAVHAADPGDPVRLLVRREGRQLQVEVTPRPVRRLSPQPILGVHPNTVNARIALPVPVEVVSDEIGGPSAGLMIALTVFDKIDPVDLADGRRIAGTGTMGLDGTIGPIGGIEQKVTAAAYRRVDVFLAPGIQLEQARQGLPRGSHMTLVGVNTFQEALDALRRGVTPTD